MLSILKAFRTASNVRYYSLKIKKRRSIPYIEKKFEFDSSTLKDRTYLRSFKPYEAPDDAKDQVITLCKQLNVPVGKKPIEDAAVRFSLLNECHKTFNHCVPNSMLHTIESVDDIIEFYQTSVNTLTPYEKLQTIDLPKNLHVQFDYHRFHPDTDTAFGGVTAFPESSTLVTGLKYKKKYPGHYVKPKPIEE